MVTRIARVLGALGSAAILLWPVFLKAQQPRVLPNEIALQAVQRVKLSTVYIKVTDQQEIASGSGFLAIEPGIVVTNAHVIGMLEKGNKPPAKIDVFINSGEPNEVQLPAKILGVDRTVDLAVLRLDGKMPDGKAYPPPLPLDATALYETQKLYVFGFPLGERLGKNVTVSESSVSALRKDAAGQLQKIQVNGGMQPGNSGGPVVNSVGQVVGVSVSIIRNTQINFAIPVTKVQTLVHGRLDEVKAGELFKDGDEVRVPLKCYCLDPLKKIREVRLEVWAGKPTDKYPASSKQSVVLPKDAARQTHKMTYETDVATLDVALPKLQPGQVAWVQPVIVTGKESRWMAPQSFDGSLAIERAPADLTCKWSPQERTSHLAVDWTFSQGSEKLSTRNVELDLLETVAVEPHGNLIKTSFGPLKMSEQRGPADKKSPDGTNLLQGVPPSYLVDATNKLRKKVNAQFNLQQAGEHGEELAVWHAHICMGYEAANLVLPNRQVQPGETWTVKAPLELNAINIPAAESTPEMELTYTFEGIREREGKKEALVSFEGNAKSPVLPVKTKKKGGALDFGPVSGKFTFDVAKGFISSVKMNISPDIAVVDFLIDISLTRTEGNTKKIEPSKINEALVKRVRTYNLSDVEELLKKSAQIKVEQGAFIPIKEAMAGGKPIFGSIPTWLQESSYYTPGMGGATGWTVESDGVVVMAVSPRYRSGESTIAPNSGIFTGLKQPWYWECMSRSDLMADNWRACGMLPIRNVNWFLYFRECKKGESLRVRTEKDLAPILFK